MDQSTEIEKLRATNKKLLYALQKCITAEGAACFNDMKNHPERMQRRLYAITNTVYDAFADAARVQ